MDRYGSSYELQWQSLRWTIADSPLFEEGQLLLQASHELIVSGPDQYADSPGSDETIDFIFDTAVEVLAALDKEKIFGVGPERDRIILGIWMGNQSDEERLAYVELLNSPKVLDRFRDELAQDLSARVEMRPSMPGTR